MRGFGLELIEREGHRSSTVMTASDYEELLEKLAERTGTSGRIESICTDGGEDE
ncbi:hypothetical protein [Haladaptatus cibarius]|uniref:hypothetical protein n=1 Tax=Haladaptatus cibarius TaxID=453847 RepID=UPI000B186BA3|nr:hypothetical protein [Haladaptatus cibarius]